jgi:hypothetical protein
MKGKKGQTPVTSPANQQIMQDEPKKTPLWLKIILGIIILALLISAGVLVYVLATQ